jgi:transcriptional regulator with XRE-family HTH domain
MNALGEIIKEFRVENKMSYRKLSRLSGLSHTFIENIEKNKSMSGRPISPTIESLYKLSSAMNMDMKDVLIKMGYID